MIEQMSGLDPSHLPCIPMSNCGNRCSRTFQSNELPQIDGIMFWWWWLNSSNPSCSQFVSFDEKMSLALSFLVLTIQSGWKVLQVKPLIKIVAFQSSFLCSMMATGSFIAGCTRNDPGKTSWFAIIICWDIQNVYTSRVSSSSSCIQTSPRNGGKQHFCFRFWYFEKCYILMRP